jgi:tellurite resistance protein
VLLRLLPWIYKPAYAPSYWAFTFGATALAFVPLREIELGETGALAELAPYLFVAANALVILVAIGTLNSAARGRLAPTRPLSLAQKINQSPIELYQLADETDSHRAE